ncbi:MAG TPA: hypothetical protein VFK44_13880 [Bacillales bacterium]|nr:hypothetical protein [Bacillales bacterium]
MRKIVVFNSVSVDGYFAGPHGEIDWLMHERSRLDLLESRTFSSGIVLLHYQVPGT